MGEGHRPDRDRRCSRLLDEIADVDRQLDHLESEGVASGTVFPADLDRLRTRRAKLCRNLERRPVWPRLIRDLMALGFWGVLSIPVVFLHWVMVRAAWEMNRPLMIAALLATLLIPLLRLVVRTWFDSADRAIVASASGAAGLGSTEDSGD